MFKSSSEEMDVCPDCLRVEFSQARPVEVEEVRRMNDAALRRQNARAARLREGFQSGSAFSAYGKLRFALGIVIFLVCVFLFLIASGQADAHTTSFLPADSQRPVSAIFCWVAAALVFTSTRTHKWFIYPLVLFFVVAGWFMPTMWNAYNARQRQLAADAIAASGVQADGTAKTQQAKDAEKDPNARGRELTEDDLAIFREKKAEKGSTTNYAIYVSTRDAQVRQNIRDAIARLLEAESCVAYTRAQGSLFIVSGAAGGSRNISRLVARFGDLNYTNPRDGVYEVAFLPDKVNAVSRYSSEVLVSPSNPTFVSANIAELRNLLDPQRVRAAASALAAADVQVLRKDIHAALIEVLRDPWQTEPDAYEAMVQALVIYAPLGDGDTVDACRKYFFSCRAGNRKPSLPVLERLIDESPDEMVAPIVELWSSNPVEWETILSRLGNRTQERLLSLLGSTESLQLIGSILKHLEAHGNADAIPTVRKFIDHPDSLISRTARTTLRTLEMQAV